MAEIISLEQYRTSIKRDFVRRINESIHSKKLTEKDRAKIADDIFLEFKDEYEMALLIIKEIK